MRVRTAMVGRPDLQGMPGTGASLACDLPVIFAPHPGILSARREPMPDGDERHRECDRHECEEAHRHLDLLYREQAPALQRRIRARLYSSDEASDLVHDAFARLLGAFGRQRLRQPEAFLNRIVSNLLIDRSRRRRARPRHVPIDEEEDRLAVAPEQDQQIELAQMRDRYRDLVASLPPRMREVFILHRVEDLGYSEIAARLDISVRTVEWHIAEAIVRIGKGLEAE
jgi:RNA polymerase sigma factor (sigma-70 family)